MKTHTISFYRVTMLLVGLVMIGGCLASNSMAPTTGTVLTDEANDDVGTLVSNPKPPTQLSIAQLIPDFDQYIVADSELTTPTTQSMDVTGGSATEDDITTEDALKIAQIRRLMHQDRQALTNMGQAFMTVAGQQNNFVIGATAQTLSLDEPHTVLSQPWQDITPLTATLLADPAHSGFVRAYFMAGQQAPIVGSYLFSLNDQRKAIRGALVYADPQTSPTPDTNQIMFLGTAFDFLDPTKNLMVSRYDRISPVSHERVAENVYYQCNSNSQTCVGEWLSITQPSPDRQISTQSYRYGWTKGSWNLCVAKTTYGDTGTTLSAPVEFDLSLANQPRLVSRGQCSIITPEWNQHIFSATDLPLRTLDTTPMGGSAAQWFGDGSTTSWDQYLVPELINDWLLTSQE